MRYILIYSLIFIPVSLLNFLDKFEEKKPYVIDAWFGFADYIPNAIKRYQKEYQKYFDLPDEYEATMWAINYMRNNVEKVAKFWNELQAAIMSFYKLNKVVFCLF